MLTVRVPIENIDLSEAMKQILADEADWLEAAVSQNTDLRTAVLDRALYLRTILGSHK
jgi:hypothetical protein